LICREPQQAVQWKQQLLEHDLKVVVITNGSRTARSLLDQARPRVVVTDLRLIDGTALAMVQWLGTRPEADRPLVVVVTQSDDDPLLHQALRAGAGSYYLGNPDGESLANCVLRALAGEANISPAIARRVLDHFERSERENRDVKTLFETQNPILLTAPERDLLARLAKGHDLAQIAEAQDVHRPTLAVVARRIYRKLQWDVRASQLSLQVA
jgi:DNA-binding NarL/FixJ family response regulator